jgi:multisubunit Na+/H+ antiporter MnhF subunit
VIPIAVNVALSVVGLSMLLCAYRAIRGPTLPDRIVAFDAWVSNLIAVVVLLTMRDRFPFGMDLVLIIAILGFLGTVAVAKYLKGGDIFA